MADFFSVDEGHVLRPLLLDSTGDLAVDMHAGSSRLNLVGSFLW